jgi:Protein of unknown function (DUF2946)
MRARSRRGRIWAAWLGLLALAFNALVPVHLAFDLAEALAPSRHHPAHDEAGGAERDLLALISGHREAESPADEHGKHGHNHHHGCPVCSSLGTLGGFAPPTPVVLPAPLPATLPAAPPLVEHKAAATPAGYRSRAPPTA